MTITPNGSEFQVNTVASGNQVRPSIARLVDPATGAFAGTVVVWTTDQNGHYDVMMQRYDAAGSAVGGPVTVNTATTGYHAEIYVTVLSNGCTVVAFNGDDNYGYGIWAQVYAPDGTAIGTNIQVSAANSTYQFDARPAEIAGGFVITYSEQWTDGDGDGIFAQRFALAHTGPGTGATDYTLTKSLADGTVTDGSTDAFRVSATTAGNQSLSQALHLADGSVLVFYQSPDASQTGVFARKLNADGTLGAEVHVSSELGAYQGRPDAVQLDNGNVMVVYTSLYQDGSSYGVYGRVLDGSGNPLGDEFRLSAATAGYQSYDGTNEGPQIAKLGDGTLVVAWGADGPSYEDVFVRHLDANGNPDGLETVLNQFVDYYQFGVDLVATEGNGFAAVWQSTGNGYDIRSGNFTVTGAAFSPAADFVSRVGGEDLVPTHTVYSQENAHVVRLPDGGYVIAWASQTELGTGDGSNWGLFAQRYAANGDRVGGEFQLNENPLGEQYHYDIAATPTGGLVVTWHNYGTPGDQDSDVWARAFDASMVGGSQFRVNSGAELPGEDAFPDVAVLSDGSFVVTYRTYYEGGVFYSIFAQRFSSAGTPDGARLHVSEANGANATDNSEHQAEIIALEAGRFIVVFEDNSGEDGSGNGLFGRIYEADGTAGTTFRVTQTTANDQSDTSLALLPGGGFVATWSSLYTDGSGWGVYARIFDANGVPVGDEFRVSENTQYDQINSRVAVLADGSFVIAWSSDHDDGIASSDVYAARFTSTGVHIGGEFLIDRQNSSQSERIGDIAATADGFVVTWVNTNNGSSTEDGSERGVFKQQFRVDGIASLSGDEQARAPLLTVSQAQGAEDTAIPLSVAVALDDANPATPQVLTIEVANIPTGATLSDGAGHSFSATAYDHAVNISDWTLSGLVITPPLDRESDFTIEVRATATEVGSADHFDQATSVATILVDVVPQVERAAPGDPSSRVNSFTANSQDDAHIAIDPAGNRVVVWTSYGADGSSTAVQMQRYAPDGSPTGSEVTVNSTASGFQGQAEVTFLADGKFVVVWRDDSPNRFTVHTQTFNADGTRAGAEHQISPADSYYGAFDPSVAALADGGFIVAFHGSGSGIGTDASQNGIFAQRFDASGNEVLRDGSAPGTAVFALNATTAGDQTSVHVAALANGGFMAVWQGYNQAGDQYNGLFGQAFDASGNAAGSEFHVNTSTDSEQYEAHITALAGGNVLVTWSSASAADSDPSSFGAFGRIFASDGTAVTGELRLNSFTEDSQGSAAVAALPDGGFVAAWHSYNEDGSYWGVFAQRFAADGDPIGQSWRMNSSVDYSQLYPDIAYDAHTNSIVAVWQDDALAGDGSGYGVATRAYALPTINGQATGGLVTVPTTVAHAQQAPATATFADGSYIVVWQTQPAAGAGDASSWSVRGQRFDADGTRSGGEFTINSNVLGDQSQPEVAVLDNGNYIVVWHSETGDPAGGYGIFGQLFAADGSRIGGEIQLSQAAGGNQIWADVAALHGAQAGGFAISWELNDNVYARAFDAAGNPLSGDLFVSVANERVTSGDYSENRSRIAAGPDGGFVVVFQDYDGDKNSWAAIGQRYTIDGGVVTPVGGTNADGSVSAANFRINSAFYGEQANPTVAYFPDGRFLVVWESQAPGQYGLYGQFFGADGSLSGGEFQVDPNLPGLQPGPEIAVMPDGSFLVAFANSSFNGAGENVNVVHLDQQGRVIETFINPLPYGQSEPAIALQGNGFNLVFTSSDGRDGWGSPNSSEGNGVLLQHYALDFGAAPGHKVAQTPVLTAPATAIGGEDTAIAVPLVAAIADSDGGSETLRVQIVGLPIGTKLADGSGNTFTADAQHAVADVTGWSLSGLTVTPPKDFNGTLTLQIEAIATEARLSAGDPLPQDIAINTATVRIAVSPVDEVLPAYGAERQDNSTTGSSQYEPSVASQADGTYLVVWRSDYQYQDGQGGPYYQVMGQLHAADGSKIGSEFSITRYTGQDASDPEAIVLADGTYLVTYNGSGDGSSSGIYAQRISASGELLDADGSSGTPVRVLVNTYTNYEQSDSEVVATVDGGYMVTWRSQYQDGSGWGVFAQRFNADGSKNGGEIQLNADDPQVGDPLSGGIAARDNHTGDQLHPAVTQLAGGDFLFTWYTPDNEGDGIVGRILHADGTMGRVFAISGTQPFDQEFPQVASLANGRAVVVWNSWYEDGSGFGVYGQLVNPDGSLQGTQFRISSYGYDSQQEPTLAALPDGGFMVTWTSAYQDGDSWGVYGQRYDAGAIPVGTEFRINTTVPGDQSTPAIAVQGDGSGVIVAFEGQDGSGYGVFDVRLPLPDATLPQDIERLGQETRVNPTETAGAQWDQAQPVIGKLADGSYVVVYQSNGQDGSSWGVYARHYTAGGDPIAWNQPGDPLEMRINVTTSSDQSAAAIVGTPDGGFVIAWHSYNGGGTGWDIMARRFSADGSDNPLKDAASVDAIELKVTSASGNYTDQIPNLAVNADGSIVVAWQSDRIGQSWEIFTHAIDASGQLAAGGDTRINVITGGEQRNVDLASLANGTIVAVWHSYGQDGSDWGIYGRLLDASGQPLAGGSDFLINSYTDGEQTWPSVAALAGGGFVVAWDTYTGFDSDASSYGIAAQRFDNAGNTLGGEIQINGIARDAQIVPDVIATQDGGFIVAWESDNADGSSRAIELRRFDSAGAALDPYGNDVQANTVVTSGYQGQVALALLDRGFVAAWQSHDLDFGTSQSDNIRMQRFAGAGLEPPPYIVDPAHGGDSDSDTVFSTIQEAIDAAPTGRTILIMGGNYSEALTIGTDDLKLTNAVGQAVVITSPDPDHAALTVASGVSVTIAGDVATNLQFVSAAAGGAAGGLAIDFVGNNDQTVLNKITVTGSGAGARFGTGETGIVITNSVFNGPDNVVIGGADGADLTTDVQILRNTFNTTGGSAVDTSGQGGKISLNVFAETAGTASDDASLVLRGSGVDVSTNNFEAGSGPHIRPIAGTYSQGALITQNSFPEGYVTVASNNAVYATIAQALSDAVANDAVSISGGNWASEGTVSVPVDGLTITAPGGVQPATGIAVQLAEGIAKLTLAGGADIAVSGSSGDNLIVGNDGANTIDGGDGTDAITVSLGTGGVDTVNGGGDDDDTVILETVALGGATIDLAESGGVVTAATGGQARATVSGAEKIVVQLANSGDITVSGFTPTPSGLDSINAEIFGDSGNNRVDASAATGFITVHSSAGADDYIGGPQAILTLDYRGNGGTHDVGINLSAVDGGIIGSPAAHTAIDEWGYTDFVSASGVAIILTGDGNDVVYGGDENDFITTGAGNDIAVGGGGDDVFYGDPLGTKQFHGGTGDDFYSVANAATAVFELAGEGYDRVFTALASYTLPDNVEYLEGTSALGQVLVGNSLGNTIVTGGAGNDTVDGGEGDDTIVASLGADSYEGGAGSDTVSFAGLGGPISVDLAAGSAAIDGGAAISLSGIENVIGGTGNDSLHGDDGANVLVGNDGDDDLVGHAGDDILDGGAGSDTAVYFAAPTDGLLHRQGTAEYWFDATSSGEGSDTLRGIEFLRFAGADGVAGTSDDRLFAVVNGNVGIQVAADSGSAMEAGGLHNDAAAANATGNVLANDVNLDQDAGAGDIKQVTQVIWTGASGPGVGDGTANATAVTQQGVTIAGRYGRLTIAADGSYTYAPDPSSADLLPQGSTATEVFTYTADDGSDNPASTTLTINLAGANDAPIAVNVATTGSEDAASIGGTLSASDVDLGANLTYALVAGSVMAGGVSLADAAVSVNTNGTYSYVPGGADEALNQGETRVVTFAYKASDGSLSSPAATATITVTGVNDAPTAVADLGATSENSPILVDVLANDLDPDTTHAFILTGASAPAGKGSATISGNQLYWNPGTAFDHLAAGATEDVVIGYTMVDDNGAASAATLTVTVTGLNDAPVPAADVVAANEDQTTAANIRAAGVLGNDIDPDDGETATLTVTGAHAGSASDMAVPQGGAIVVGTYGSLTIQQDGTYSYAPDNAAAQALSEGAGATDVFSYTVRDAQGATAATTLTFAITGANDAPVANADQAFLLEDSGATDLTALLLSNDTDVDTGSSRKITAAGTANHGTVSLVGGSLTYTPDADFNGSDSFDYTITDDFGATSTATVTVMVGAVSDPVNVSAPAGLNLLEDAVGVPVSGLSISDVDATLAPAGVYQVSLSATHGTLALSTMAGLTFSVGDGTSNSAMTFHGTLADLNAALASASYTPDANYNGSAEIVLAATDGFGGTVATGEGMASADSKSISVVVASVNDAPAGQSSTVAALEDVPFTFGRSNFGFSDTVDGDDFAGVVITTLPVTGALLLDGTALTAGTYVSLSAIEQGQLTYLAPADANGPDLASFTFQVQDNGGTANGGQDTDQSANTLTIDVTAVNDAPVVTIDTGSGSYAKIGGETHVNSFIGDSQTGPSSAGLADGGYVVAWSSYTQDGSDWGVYAQRYDASGNPTGAEFRVNSTTQDSQNQPHLVALSDGGFVVVWTGFSATESFQVLSQRYDASGNKVGGETLVSNTTAGAQYSGDIVSLRDGGYVVTWMSSQNGTDYDIYARRFDASGAATGSEFRVNATVAGNQFTPSGAALADGGYVVTWQLQNQSSSDGAAIYAQRFDLSGAPQGDEISFATDAFIDKDPVVAGLAAGGFAIAWTRYGSVDSSYDIYMQRFDASGSALGGMTLVNSIEGTQQKEVQPTILGLKDGGFLVAWHATNGVEEIRGQFYDANGVAQGDAIVISSDLNHAKELPTLSELADGDILVTWAAQQEANFTLGVYSQRLDYSPAQLTATEQASLSLKHTIAVSDIDAGSGVVSVTLSVDYGVVNVTEGTSGATVVSGNGTGSVVVSGTLSQLKALLDTDSSSTVTFTADTDAPPASAMLTVTANDGGSTGAGGAMSAVQTATINITPIDDPAVARNDAVTTAENAVKTGSVFADNGSGADSDVDGPALQVASVNGQAASVGTQITLASGALLTVNADGTYSYDPNGKFDYLAPAGSGAANAAGGDSFTYTLVGGGSAAVSITVTGVAGPGTTTLTGGAGDDTITGTGWGDLFDLGQGGSDTALGGGGSDGFYMGAALDAGDSIDGGTGADDQVGLQGSYAGYTFGAGNLVDIETLVLLSGSDTRFGDTAGNAYSYDLATVDANVAAGRQLVVNANALLAGENLTFDGSAETDGSFFFYGGAGDDVLTGGQQNDAFYFGVGLFGAGDRVDGQGGVNQLGLQGNYALTFGANQLGGIDTIALLSGADTRFAGGAARFDYALTMDDGNLGAGARMTINANDLRADETLSFDGSAETGGAYTVYSGAGDDTLVGGAGADVLFGGEGADTLTGGAGNDVFGFTTASGSAPGAADTITDFTLGDTIDLTRIDAVAGTPGNEAFTWIGSEAFGGHAGELRIADQGSGNYLVQGDTDGDGTADFQIVVHLTDSGTHPLGQADFWL